MSVRLADLRPGDVLLTFSEGWGSTLIRLGQALRGKPSLHNHVAVYSHTQPDTGEPWGLEGRGGGFGWKALGGYLDAPGTISNAWQPGRTDTDRAVLIDKLKALLKTEYDYRAYAVFAMEVFDRRAGQLIEQATEWPEGRPPTSVVCSSVLDWAYEDRNWANPGGLAVTRWTWPGDWTELVVSNRWHLPPT